MIVNNNTNPEKDLYYLGAKVIEVLDASKNNDFDYFELYKKIKEKNNIKIRLFNLVLTWLFIIGIIKNSEYNKIKKCF